MIALLDLEETLIDNWNNAFLLPENISIINEMLSMVDGQVTVGLMSWAVWNEEDKVNFNQRIRPELEEALGFKFSDELVWSMDDWATNLFKSTGKKISREDLFDCFGKQEVLFMISRAHSAFTGGHVVLIDDAVEHGLHWNAAANNCFVLIQNIVQLKKEINQWY